jgi:hypothetical protein
MRKIAVDKIEDAMVLAQDVCASSGNVLLGKGTTLSAAMGRRLKNWGIASVAVEGTEEVQADTAAATVSPEEIKQELQNKFSRVLDKSVMQEIFSAVYKFKLQKSKTEVSAQ